MDCIVQIVILVQMVRRPFDVALHGCPKPVQQPAVETENEFLPDCALKALPIICSACIGSKVFILSQLHSEIFGI